MEEGHGSAREDYHPTALLLCAAISSAGEVRRGRMRKPPPHPTRETRPPAVTAAALSICSTRVSAIHGCGALATGRQLRVGIQVPQADQRLHLRSEHPEGVVPCSVPLLRN